MVILSTVGAARKMPLTAILSQGWPLHENRDSRAKQVGSLRQQANMCYWKSWLV